MLALTTLRPRLPRPRARHPPGRRQAGQPGVPLQPRRLGRHLARGRRRGRRRASSCAPATRRSCFVTSDAQLLHFGAGGVRPQGRSGGGIAGIKLAAGARVVSFGAVDPAPTPCVVTVSGASHGAARHRGRVGQGDPVRGVPRQGPRHRRRPLPPVPQGRGRRWSSPGPAPRRRCAAAASGAPVDLPGAGRPARRLRHPGQPADRRLRRAGHRVAARLGGDRRGRLTPCCPSPPCSPSCGAARRCSRRCSCSPAAAAASDEGQPEARARPRSCSTAKKIFDDASSVHIVLRTDSSPPDGVQRRRSAPTATVTHDPAFEGEVKVVLERPHRDRPDHRGRRQGLRQAAALDRLRRRSTRPTTAPPTRPTSSTPTTGLSSLLTQIDGLKKGKDTRARRPDPDHLHRHPARRGGQADHPERERQGDLRHRRSASTRRATRPR